MRYCTVKESGEIVQTGIAGNNTTLEDLIPCGDIPLLNIPDYVHHNTHFYLDGEFYELGDKPEDCYYFDYERKVWCIDLASLVIKIKATRDMLLYQSDWTQLPDVDAVTTTNWLSYRQALRDITEQAGYPTNVEWPIKPSK